MGHFRIRGLIRDYLLWGYEPLGGVWECPLLLHPATFETYMPRSPRSTPRSAFRRVVEDEGGLLNTAKSAAAAALGSPSDILETVGYAANRQPGMPPLDIPYGSDYWAKRFGANLDSPTGFLGAVGTPDISDLGRLGPLLGMTLFHGSPHKFNMFEISQKTSRTGEGAQVYGHGMYFARDKGTGQWYQKSTSDDTKYLRNGKLAKKTSDNDVIVDALTGKAYGGKKPTVPPERVKAANIRYLRGMRDHHHQKVVWAEKQLKNPNLSKFDQTTAEWTLRRNLEKRKMVDEFITDVQNDVKFEQPKGNLYEVEVDDAHFEKMLDYDEYIDKQDWVIDALEEKDPKFLRWLDKHGEAIDGRMGVRINTADLSRPRTGSKRRLRGSDLYREYQKYLYDEYTTALGKGDNAAINAFRGGDNIDMLPIEASNRLREAGIPGIKYMGEEDMNVVLFDMGLIDQVKRNDKLVYKKSGF